MRHSGVLVPTCRCYWVCVLALLAHHAAGSNNRPIIGILTVPTFQQCTDEPAATGAALGPLSDHYDCYVPAAYVKLVEAAGARVALLPCRVNDHFQRIMRSVNGFLLTGMFTDYQCRSAGSARELTPYGEAGRAVIQHVQASQNIPLFAECKGFNMLMFLISGMELWTDLIRDDIASLDQAAPIRWNTQQSLDAIHATQVYRAASKLGAEQLLTNGKNLMNRHPYGVLPGNYSRCGRLTQVFGPYVATTIDNNGVEYVSIVESITPPIIGAATHPEKVLFQWTRGLETPHSANAVRLNQLWGMWLVEAALQTNASFADRALERAALVYNQTTHALWDSRAILDGNFMQLYFTEAKVLADRSPSHSHCPSSSNKQSNGMVFLGAFVGLFVGVLLTLGLAVHKKRPRELDGQLTELSEK